MRFLLALAACLLYAGLASPALADSKVVDKDHHLILSADELEKLAVLHDAKGHYIVVTRPESAHSFMFYGDRSKLHRVRMLGLFSSDALAHSWTIESPRLEKAASFLELSSPSESWSFRCEDRQSSLSLADDKTRAEVLQATFMPPRWRRYPYLLSRDSRGVYYYVDDAVDEGGAMQLYVGRPGKTRNQPIIDTVNDSEGAILFTRRGKLRIDGRYGSSDRKVTWIVGKKRTELLVLDEQLDTKLIYNVLGVYAAVHLGNPCEDL